MWAGLGHIWSDGGTPAVRFRSTHYHGTVPSCDIDIYIQQAHFEHIGSTLQSHWCENEDINPLDKQWGAQNQGLTSYSPSRSREKQMWTTFEAFLAGPVLAGGGWLNWLVDRNLVLICFDKKTRWLAAWPAGQVGPRSLSQASHQHGVAPRNTINNNLLGWWVLVHIY